MSSWKPLAAGLAFGLAAAFALPGAARAQDRATERATIAPAPLPAEAFSIRRAWAEATPDARIVVDQLAAAYFSEALAWPEQAAFETETAEVYRLLTPDERNRMRAERKARRAAMARSERRSLLNQKEPAYAHLDDARRMALRARGFELLAAMPADERAQRLADARRTPQYAAYAASQPATTVRTVGY
ncbi:MAG: hypothetical protein AAFR11_14370 [Pseudomonadota bacterium]